MFPRQRGVTICILIVKVFLIIGVYGYRYFNL